MSIPEDKYGVTFKIVENKNNSISTKPEIVLIRFPDGTEEYCDVEDTEFMNECLWVEKCANIDRERSLEYASAIYPDGAVQGEYFDLVYSY